MVNKTWTREEIDRALDLWRAGETTTRIGHIMGRSKSAIAGVLHRERGKLGEEKVQMRDLKSKKLRRKREEKEAKTRAKEEKKRLKEAKRAAKEVKCKKMTTASIAPPTSYVSKPWQAHRVKVAAGVEKPPEGVVHWEVTNYDAGTSLRLPLVDLEPHQCKWPVNDREEDGQHLFCGLRADKGPYCRHHTERSTGLGTPSERRALQGLAGGAR